MEYLTSETVQDILVIGFPMTNIVDPITVNSISDEVEQKVEDSDLRRLILDFTGVTFVSSGLIGSLVELRKYCQANGVTLKLAGLSSSLREVLQLTNLRTLFKTYRTRNSAIEMFAADDFMVRHEFFESYANSVSNQFETNDFSNAVPVAVAPLRLTVENEANVLGF